MMTTITAAFRARPATTTPRRWRTTRTSPRHRSRHRPRAAANGLLVVVVLHVLATEYSGTGRRGTQRRTTVVQAQGVIPGTSATHSGYDTEMGHDPICWYSTPDDHETASENTSSSSASNSSTSIPLPNPLVADYRISREGVVLMHQGCPMGNTLAARAPLAWRKDPTNRTILRAGTEYVYDVQLLLNLTSLGPATVRMNDEDGAWPLVGNTTNTTNPYLDYEWELVSDEDDGPVVAVQLIGCVLGAGFCSPFIHEAANARLSAEAAAMGNLPVPPVPRGASHGGTHTHSAYQFVRLPPFTTTNSTAMTNTTTDQNHVFDVSVPVPMLMNDPNQYYMIAAVQLFVGYRPRRTLSPASISPFEDDETPPAAPVVLYRRYDMSNALPLGQRVITYQAPATIQTVSDPVRYLVDVAVALVTAGVLYLVVHLARYRQHQVLQLTQGAFLIAFGIAALGASVSPLFMEPSNDTYCRTGLTLSTTCLQFMYAVTLGRLWRIHAVVSPLLVQTLRVHQDTTTGRSRPESLLMRALDHGTRRLMSLGTGDSPPFACHSCCVRPWCHRHAELPGHETKSARRLRRNVPARRLVVVIALVMLPQLILQLLAGTLQTLEFTMEYNSAQSQGRTACLVHGRPDLAMWQQLRYWTIVVLALTVLLLLAMAHAARDLPSLFNETHVIFDSATSTLGLLALGMMITLLTDDPTVSPDFQYLVSSLTTLCLVVNLTGRILLPKLRLVWRNEKVLVSRLVSSDQGGMSSDSDRGTSSLLLPPSHRDSHTSHHHYNPLVSLDPREASHSQSTDHGHTLLASHDADHRHHEVPPPSSNVDEAPLPTNHGPGERVDGPNKDWVSIIPTDDSEINSTPVRDHPVPPLDACSDAVLLDDAELGEGMHAPSNTVTFLSGNGDAAVQSTHDDEEPAQPSRRNPTDSRLPRPAMADVAAPSTSRLSTTHRRESSSSRRYCIGDDLAPDPHLLLRLVEFQEALAAVNARIMSGRSVPREEWIRLQQLAGSVGYTLKNEVVFAWDDDQDPPPPNEQRKSSRK